MNRKWLAWLGLLLILGSMFMTIAWADYWGETHEDIVGIEEINVWQFVEANTDLTPEQALILSLGSFVLGIMLVLLWWRKRVQQEDKWWEERDEPLRTPPPAGM